jgi:hypothetical protein
MFPELACLLMIDTDNVQNAWDSYIQGQNTMDTTNSFFPMDFGTMPMQTDGGGNGIPNAPTPTQSNANTFAGPNGNVFMVNQPDPKTSSGEGYAMGFMIPKTG